MNYAEALRELTCLSQDAMPALLWVRKETVKVAAQALERLSRVPAMKEQERIFFSICYGLRDVYRPREVVNLLADTIPHKRCWYYLEKWTNQGFYDYGVTLDLGWFCPEKLPERYRQIVAGQEPDKLQPREKIGQALEAVRKNIMVDETDPQALMGKALEELAKLPGGPYPAEEVFSYVGIDLSLLAFMDDKTESGLLEDDL
jgi:hypothetical protein